MAPKCLGGRVSVVDETPDGIGASVYIVLLVIEVVNNMAIVQTIHDNECLNRCSIN